MKAGFLLSLAAAIALLILAPLGAQAKPAVQTCGGFPNLICGPGLFCQKKTGSCSIMDMAGTCMKVPQVCSKHIRKVCGCDRKTYNNDCERQMAQVSKLNDGPCQ